MIDPEYLIDRAPKGRKMSCTCCISDTELPEPENTETKVTVTATTESTELPTTEANEKDRRLVVVLERCGECNLHNCKYSVIFNYLFVIIQRFI